MYDHDPYYYVKNKDGEFERAALTSDDHDKIFKQGATLVIVDENWSSRVHKIRPDHAAVLASLKLFREQLIKRVVHQSSPRPERRELTPEQLQAWEELKKVLDDTSIITLPSAADIVDRALEGFEEKTADLLKDPAIRKAYERLETLIELKGKHHEESNSC
jgi:hypothetical protein